MRHGDATQVDGGFRGALSRELASHLTQRLSASVWEEAGTRVTVDGLLGVQTLPGARGGLAFVFAAHPTADGEPRPDGDETDAAAYVTLAEMSHLPVDRWCRWMAERVLEGRVPDQPVAGQPVLDLGVASTDSITSGVRRLRRGRQARSDVVGWRRCHRRPRANASLRPAYASGAKVSASCSSRCQSIKRAPAASQELRRRVSRPQPERLVEEDLNELDQSVPLTASSVVLWSGGTRHSCGRQPRSARRRPLVRRSGSAARRRP